MPFSDFAPSSQHKHAMSVPAGSSVGDILEQCGIPESEVFLAFVNGRDVSIAPGQLRRGCRLEDGDVIAFSGAVPYSWGYGAPVV